MFYDFLMESADSYDTSVSESTREMVDNLEVTDFSESTMSPFDLVSKSLYEYAQYNRDTFNSIAKAEVNYLRENGVEPVWEASDHKSLATRFIEGVKKIISDITGAFQKLIDTINRKIAEVYRTYGDKMDAKIKDTGYGVDKARFNMRTYDPTIGANMMARQRPEAVINSIPVLKDLHKFFQSKGTNLDAMKESVKNAKRDETDKAIRKAVFADLGDANLSSNEEIRKSLRKAMVGEKKQRSYAEAKKELDYFVADKKGTTLKARLKDNYNKIKTDLSKCIDVAKKYGSVKEEKVPSNVAGYYTGSLQLYIQCATLLYNETNKAYTAKWFQSMRLFIKLAASTATYRSKDKKPDNMSGKEWKKAKSAAQAQDYSNQNNIDSNRGYEIESARFTFDDVTHENYYDDDDTVVYDI